MPCKFIKSEIKEHGKGTGFQEAGVSDVRRHLIPGASW